MPSNARPETAGNRAPSTAYRGPEESPGYLLWRATLLWQRTVRDALAPHGLTHVQFVILASAWWLAQHGRQPMQKDIAAHAASDQMMASQVLRRLEAQGLVSRAPAPDDTRAMLVTLTAEGRARLTAALPDVEAADEAFFRALGENRGGFIDDLARLSRTADR